MNTVTKLSIATLFAPLLAGSGKPSEMVLRYLGVNPAFVEDLKSHERCLAAYAPANKRVACCAAHSLAEVYAAVTRLPGAFRASPEQAILFLSDMEEHLTIVSLDAAEYSAIIRQAAANGILGATISMHFWPRARSRPRRKPSIPTTRGTSTCSVPMLPAE
jgi:hypothetical protein